MIDKEKKEISMKLVTPLLEIVVRHLYYKGDYASIIKLAKASKRHFGIIQSVRKRMHKDIGNNVRSIEHLYLPIADDVYARKISYRGIIFNKNVMKTLIRTRDLPALRNHVEPEFVLYYAARFNDRFLLQKARKWGAENDACALYGAAKGGHFGAAIRYLRLVMARAHQENLRHIIKAALMKYAIFSSDIHLIETLRELYWKLKSRRFGDHDVYPANHDAHYVYFCLLDRACKSGNIKMVTYCHFHHLMHTAKRGYAALRGQALLNFLASFSASTGVSDSEFSYTQKAIGGDGNGYRAYRAGLGGSVEVCRFLIDHRMISNGESIYYGALRGRRCNILSFVKREYEQLDIDPAKEAQALANAGCKLPHEKLDTPRKLNEAINGYCMRGDFDSVSDLIGDDNIISYMPHISFGDLIKRGNAHFLDRIQEENRPRELYLPFGFGQIFASRHPYIIRRIHEIYIHHANVIEEALANRKKMIELMWETYLF